MPDPTPAPTAAPTAPPPRPAGGFDLMKAISNPMMWLIAGGAGLAGYAVGGNFMWAAIAALAGGGIYLAMAGDSADDKTRESERTSREADAKTKARELHLKHSKEGVDAAHNELVASDKILAEAQKSADEAKADEKKKEAKEKEAKEKAAAALAKIDEANKALLAAQDHANAALTELKDKPDTDPEKQKAKAALDLVTAKQGEAAAKRKEVVRWQRNTYPDAKTGEDVKALQKNTKDLAEDVKTLQKMADDVRKAKKAGNEEEAKKAIQDFQKKAEETRKALEEEQKKAAALVKADSTANDKQREDAIAAKNLLDANLKGLLKLNEDLSSEFSELRTRTEAFVAPNTFVVGSVGNDSSTLAASTPIKGDPLQTNIRTMPLSNVLALGVDNNRISAIRAQREDQRVAAANNHYRSIKENSLVYVTDDTASKDAWDTVNGLYPAYGPNGAATYTKMFGAPSSVTSDLIYFNDKGPYDDAHKEGFMRVSGHYDGTDFVIDSMTFYDISNGKQGGTYNFTDGKFRLKGRRDDGPNGGHSILLNDDNKKVLNEATAVAIASKQLEITDTIKSIAPSDGIAVTGTMRKPVTEVRIATGDEVKVTGNSIVPFPVDALRGEGLEPVMVSYQGKIDERNRTFIIESVTVQAKDRAGNPLPAIVQPVPPEPPTTLQLIRKPDGSFVVNRDDPLLKTPAFVKDIMNGEVFEKDKLPSVQFLHDKDKEVKKAREEVTQKPYHEARADKKLKVERIFDAYETKRVLGGFEVPWGEKKTYIVVTDTRNGVDKPLQYTLVGKYTKDAEGRETKDFLVEGILMRHVPEGEAATTKFETFNTPISNAPGMALIAMGGKPEESAQNMREWCDALLCGHEMTKAGSDVKMSGPITPKGDPFVYRTIKVREGLVEKEYTLRGTYEDPPLNHKFKVNGIANGKSDKPAGLEFVEPGDKRVLNLIDLNSINEGVGAIITAEKDSLKKLAESATPPKKDPAPPPPALATFEPVANASGQNVKNGEFAATGAGKKYDYVEIKVNVKVNGVTEERTAYLLDENAGGDFVPTALLLAPKGGTPTDANANVIPLGNDKNKKLEALALGDMISVAFPAGEANLKLIKDLLEAQKIPAATLRGGEADRDASELSSAVNRDANPLFDELLKSTVALGARIPLIPDEPSDKGTGARRNS